MKYLRPIKYKKAYEDLIAKKITNWLWDNVFKECFNILNQQTVLNDASAIRQALESGLIYYQDNAFYSRSGRFSNAISKELKAIGAKYSSYRKAFILDKSNLPTEIVWAIDTIKARTALQVTAIQGYLTFTLGELTKEEKQLVFDTAVETIMKDLQDRVIKNFNERKIETITPKLTDFRASEIAQRYTENLNFWIKSWTNENIIKMREAVGRMAVDGMSRKTIAAYFQKEFGIAERKAQFLARNETAIATTSYLQAKYREEGFESFTWRTNIDGRERPLHKQLNGQVFRFDDPPIIDERTGEKGLPGETYNCRCLMMPVINKDWLDNRRKLYKANNSLTGKIKRCLKAITKKI